MILIDLEVEVVVPSSEEYRDPELTTNESFFELLICADMSGSACLSLVLVIILYALLTIILRYLRCSRFC